MSQPYDTNTYHATILRHIDADTTWATVSLGFDCRINLTFRWAGIDAYERNTAQGKAAIALVNEWLPVGSMCLITTLKDKREKFGRYLATFYKEDDIRADWKNVVSFNQKLIDAGYASPYDGGPR